MDGVMKNQITIKPGRLYRGRNKNIMVIERVERDPKAHGGYYVIYYYLGKQTRGITGKMYTPTHGTDIGHLSRWREITSWME